MGSFLFYAFSWWSIALRIVALVHFVRRRPDSYWIWVILIHPVGALVYIAVEVIPDAGLLRSSFQVFPRRRRIQELERTILDNLAWAYAQTGQTEKADAMFREATRISTISETYYYYALFLQSQGRIADAREWSKKILDKKPTMPGYLRRRERPWFRKASALLARLPA